MRKHKQIPQANTDIIKDCQNIKEMRIAIESWLKFSFRDVTIVNRQTKFEIGFNSKSFKKLVSGSPGQLKLIALTAIHDMIKIGELTKVDVDKKQRSEIIAYYYFESPVKIEDEVYLFWFTVRQLQNGKFIYSGNLDNKKPL